MARIVMGPAAVNFSKKAPSKRLDAEPALFHDSLFDASGLVRNLGIGLGVGGAALVPVGMVSGSSAMAGVGAIVGGTGLALLLLGREGTEEQTELEVVGQPAFEVNQF